MYRIMAEGRACMITVEILIPAMDISCDFSLDEDAQISALIEEAAALVCLRERWPIPKHTEHLELYDKEHSRKLERSSSLYESGVQPGQQLILC